MTSYASIVLFGHIRPKYVDQQGTRMKFECIVIFLGDTPTHNCDLQGGLMKFTHITIGQWVAQPIKRHVL